MHHRLVHTAGWPCFLAVAVNMALYLLFCRHHTRPMPSLAHWAPLCSELNLLVFAVGFSFLLGKYLLVAMADIAEGEEITVDYYGAQWFILPPRPRWGC